MSIEEKIKQVATEHFSDYSFVLDNWYDADTAIDKLALPAIVCLLPVSGNLQYRNGKSYDTVNIALAFLKAVPRNANGEDNDKAFNDMKDTGRAFIKQLNECGYFEPIDGTIINYYTIYEQLSSIVTGVFFELSLKAKLGRC